MNKNKKIMRETIELKLRKVFKKANGKPERIWMCDKNEEDWLGFLRKEGDMYVLIPVDHEELLEYRCGKIDMASICQKVLDEMRDWGEDEDFDVCEGLFESDGETINATGAIMDRQRCGKEFGKGKRRYPNPNPEDENKVMIEEMRIYCPDLYEEIMADIEEERKRINEKISNFLASLGAEYGLSSEDLDLVSSAAKDLAT